MTLRNAKKNIMFFFVSVQLRKFMSKNYVICLIFNATVLYLNLSRKENYVLGLLHFEKLGKAWTKVS